jgi:erythronate-4-phosphate dehydrogenase
VIAALQKNGDLQKNNIRAGVVGVGEIGSQVAEKLKLLNFEVVLCDPFRKDINSITLEEMSDLDFITLHTPLTRSGEYPTFHMIEKDFLKRQKKDCVLLNAGRGSVINFSDLKLYGQHLKWCLDVWENEPNIDLEILQKSLIATPHIAGYSVQSRYRSAEMLYQAVLKTHLIPDRQINPITFPTQSLTFDVTADWRDVVLKIYDPTKTSAHTKAALIQQKETFDQLRKNFPERHEWESISSPLA